MRGTTGNDLFVNQTDALWTADFVARSVNSGEVHNLDGWRRSHDTFSGEGGHDTLLLREPRSAVFLDDIYSPQEGDIGGRFSNITEIRGTGETCIDLTSSRWSTADRLLRAGDGDSLLWASSGNDILVGGVGNDNLHGGAGDDILVGNGGNDILDGGGGKDMFVLNPELGGQSVLRQSGAARMTLLVDGGLTADDILFRQDGNNAVLTRNTDTAGRAVAGHVDTGWQASLKDWYTPGADNRVVFGDPALTAAIAEVTGMASVGQQAQSALDELKNRLQGALASV